MIGILRAGKDMKIMTNLFTPREYVKVAEEESGKKIKLHEVTFEDFDKAAAIPGLHELWAKYVSSLPCILRSLYQ